MVSIIVLQLAHMSMLFGMGKGGLFDMQANIGTYIAGLIATTVYDIGQALYQNIASSPSIENYDFAILNGKPVSVMAYLGAKKLANPNQLRAKVTNLQNISNGVRVNMTASGTDSNGIQWIGSTNVTWMGAGQSKVSTIASPVTFDVKTSGNYEFCASIANTKKSCVSQYIEVIPPLDFSVNYLVSKKIPGDAYLWAQGMNVPYSQVTAATVDFDDGTPPVTFGGTSGNLLPASLFWYHQYPVGSTPKSYKVKIVLQTKDKRIAEHRNTIVIMPKPNQLPVQPPSVTRRAPQYSSNEAQFSSKLFRISAVDGDSNMSQLQWLIDGAPQATIALANEGIAMTKSQSLKFNQAGNHKVTARVTDATGNTDSVFWMVNVSPSNKPTVVSTLPTYSVGQTSGKIPVSVAVVALTTFKASFNDVDKDMRKVYWLIDGDTVWTNTVGSYPYATTYSHRFVAPKGHTVSVISEDSLGNRARVDWAVQVGSNTPGNHAPTVKIIPPSHSGNGSIQYHVGQFYDFRYDAYDVDTTVALNLAYGEVKIDGKTNWYGPRTNFSHILHGSADNFSVASGLSFSKPGLHTISVLVRDAAGLSGTNSLTVNVLSADANSSTPPVIQSVFPDPAKTYYVKAGGSFSGQGLIFDKEADLGVTGRLEWWVDGVYKQSSSFSDFPSDKFTFTINNLSVAPHTIELRPFDDSGNQGASVFYHVNGVATLPNFAPTAVAILPAQRSLTIAPGTRIRFKVKAEDMDGGLTGYPGKIQWSGCGLNNYTSVWGGYVAVRTFAATPLTSGVITATVVDNKGNVSNAMTWNITIGTPSTGNAPQILNPTWTSGTHFRVLGKTKTIGLSLGFTAIDPNGDLARVESYVDGKLIRTTNIGSLEGFSENYDGGFRPLYFGSSQPLPRGSSGSIEIRIIDKAGNIASHKATYTAGYNRPPVVTASVPVSMLEDSVFSDVINATDPDGDKVTFTITGQPLHGDAKITNGNKLTYTPAVNYFGSDTVTVGYSDGFGGTGSIVYHITVTSVNDIPVLRKNGTQVLVAPGQTVPMSGILKNLAQDVETPAASLVTKALLVPTGWVISKPTQNPATWSYTVPASYAAGQKTLSQFVVVDANAGESLPFGVEFLGQTTTDLAITKTDGQTTAVTGKTVTYTITATNNGPDPVTGATVADALPTSLTGATWSCTASTGSVCAASGSGNINDAAVNLLSGGIATYTLTAALSATATGNLVNTATITAPVGVTDTNAANNTSTDTDTIVAPVQAKPVVTTIPATIITATGATLSGSGNPNGVSATGWFEYGTSTAYGNTTSPVVNLGTGKVAKPFSAQISGLTCNTLYHFRAVAKNVAGTVNGADKTFTTAACANPGGTQHIYNLNNNQVPVDLALVINNAAPSSTGTVSVTGGQLVVTPVDANGWLETKYTVSGAARIRAKATATIAYSYWGISSGIEFVDAAGNKVLTGIIGSSVSPNRPQHFDASGGATLPLPALGSYNIELIADANQVVANLYDLNNKLLGTITPTYLNGKTFADIAKVRFIVATTTNSNASIDNLLVDAGSSGGIKNGLVAYYPFNGNANDVSINGWNGVVNGATLTMDRNGKSNSAYAFNGASSINVTANIPEVNFTIGFWFKTTDANAGLFSVSKGMFGGANDRHVYLNAGKLVQRIWNNQVISSTRTGLNDGKWHYATMVVKTGVGQKLYVDGNLEASGTKDRSDFTGQTVFQIGYSGDAINPYLLGSLDEVRIYNRPLSAVDVSSLFQLGTTPSSVSDLVISNTNRQTTVVSGAAVTYTITATNKGPDPVTGATVADTLPASLTGATWSCTASTGSGCTASGTGSINDAAVNLLSGGTATYTLKATLNATATGNLVNTATITVPVGVTDTNAANNTSTDTDKVLNQPPVSAVNAGINTLEDTPVVISATALKTTDPDNTPAQLTYTLTTTLANGALSVTGVPILAGGTFTQADIDAGSVKYTPNLNYNGLNDGFFFTVSDGVVTLPRSQFSIKVTPVNDRPAPKVTAMPKVVSDGSSVTAKVSPHDPDIGDTHTFKVTGPPTKGRAKVSLTGLVTYTPNAGARGSDKMAVTVKDQAGATGFVTIKVSIIAPVPVKPVVVTSKSSNITATSATLTGSGNPKGGLTTSWFEYGLNTAYGTTTPLTNLGKGMIAKPFSAKLSGLTCNTRYHYRTDARNVAGVSYGADKVFITKACPLAGVPAALANAKIIEIADSGASVDLTAIVADPTLNATMQGGYAVFDKPFSSYLYQGSQYGGSVGDLKTTAKIRVAVNAKGRFYLGSIANTPSEHLLVFSQNFGLNNYQNFNGQMLSQTTYTTPHESRLNADARQNLLAYAFGKTYSRFFNAGIVTGGPTDYHGLYAAKYSMMNRFNQKIEVIRSFISHQQFDYSWYPPLSRPLETARNAKWSPIANRPNQNANLSRSFNVGYLNATASVVWIQAGTDNRMASSVALYGLAAAPNYTTSGGAGAQTWAVNYNATARTYKASNANSASSMLFLRNQYPNRVAMAGNTTWSSFNDSVTIAVLGGIATTKHVESPTPGNDGNPPPLKWTLVPLTKVGNGSVKDDYNGDGKSDILYRQVSTGRNFIKLMNGRKLLSQGFAGRLPTSWTIAGNGDYNGDGKSDILYRQASSGRIYIKLMNGRKLLSQGFAGRLPTSWTIAGSGDYNGDGKSDILYRQASSGRIFIKLMNGRQLLSQGFAGRLPSSWTIAGSGDYNGDGKSDILYRQASSGRLFIKLMNGRKLLSQGFAGRLPTSWAIAGNGDYNGDGKSDILYRQTSSGRLFIKLMNGRKLLLQGFAGRLPISWTVVGNGDYNGDGKNDILYRQASSGRLFIKLMNGRTVLSQGFAGRLPASWRVVNMQ